MTAVRIVTTDQAPSAKPQATSIKLTTAWQTLIDTPLYDVPIVGFSINRRVAEGVAEPSSPIWVANTSESNVATVDVRVIRSDRPLDSTQTHVDYVGLFEGGENYSVGNTIVLTNNATVEVANVNGNGSVTEFNVTTSGDSVVPEETLAQSFISGGGSGTGFTLTPDRDNLDDTVNVISLGTNLRVEVDDVLIVPINGQFFLSRDQLQIRASANSFLQATLSYTEGQAEEETIFQQ